MNMVLCYDITTGVKKVTRNETFCHPSMAHVEVYIYT